MTSAVFGSIADENEYRQKGIIRKLSTTPITRSEWIFSTMIYQLFLAAISTVLILIVGYFAFGAVLLINIYLPCWSSPRPSPSPAWDAPRAAGQGRPVGGSPGQRHNLPHDVSVGLVLPMEQMPGFLQSFAKVLPLYYVNQGMRESMIFDNMMAAGQNTLVIGVFAIIVFALGIYLTTWKQD